MNNPLLQVVNFKNYNSMYHGSNSYSFQDPIQNNLHIKKVANSSYVRYANENPNIILNKQTNNLPLSVQLYNNNILNLTNNPR